MFKQIKLITGKSQYDIFSIWLDALLKAFGTMGIPASYLSVSESKTFVDEDTLTFGFNMSRTWAVENVHQHHFAWLVDHPVFHAEYFMPEIQKIPINHSHCIAACVSQEWKKCGHILYPQHDLSFVPHASILFEAREPDWDERVIDVVFFGSILDPAGIYESIKKRTQHFWPFIENVMNNHAYATAYKSIDYVLLDALLTQKLDPAQTVLMMNAFFPLIDQYFRNLKRIELLKQIKDTPVHVFGNGCWQKLGLPSNIQIHEAVSYKEALDIMRQSRILLNHTPTLVGGAHERIFDAISQGCAVITTASSFLQDQFGLNSGIQFYDPMVFDLIHEKLLETLNNPHQGEIIKPAQAIVHSQHTMHHRAQEIWNLANTKWSDQINDPVPRHPAMV